MLLSPKSADIKDSEMGLDGAMEQRLNRIISANSACRGSFPREEHGFRGDEQNWSLSATATL